MNKKTTKLLNGLSALLCDTIEAQGEALDDFKRAQVGTAVEQVWRDSALKVSPAKVAKVLCASNDVRIVDIGKALKSAV